MNESLFVVACSGWLSDGSNAKRLQQGLYPVRSRAGHLTDGCKLLTKFRASDGSIIIDDEAVLKEIDGRFYVKSPALCESAAQATTVAPYWALFIEGTPGDARCIGMPWNDERFFLLERDDPTLRLQAYDLPPGSVTLVDAQNIVKALYGTASAADPELFALQASRFLDAPSVVSALLGHVLTLGAEENVRFPIQVKKLAEQLRTLLQKPASTVTIGKIQKSHLNLWAEVQRQRFGFLDGGVARIPTAAALEPMAIRVGVYSVLPGVIDPSTREQWRMVPLVLGDLIDRARPTEDRPDAKRFQEAARYMFEPLIGLRHLSEFPDTRVLCLHGPLVSRFTIYDEGRPNYLPFVAPAVLQKFGIERDGVCAAIADLPHDAQDEPMWNQFMALYGYVMKQIEASDVPIVGVVERPVGQAVTIAVLHQLQKDKVVTAAYIERFLKEIRRYDITDDFLFGCVLGEGEFITPISVDKNPVHKAWGRWQPVVAQYPKPSAMLLKTEATNFPFRVEMNSAARRNVDFISRFLFHTARLLPRYAFPVGLDIVDKYAKIPDWIARGVSAELTTGVLRRALRTGDAHLVAQIKLFLAKGPRDFFFRPSSRDM